MAAQHLPRYLGGLAVDKRRTRSNERRHAVDSVPLFLIENVYQKSEESILHSAQINPQQVEETFHSSLEVTFVRVLEVGVRFHHSIFIMINQNAVFRHCRDRINSFRVRFHSL